MFVFYLNNFFNDDGEAERCRDDELFIGRIFYNVNEVFFFYINYAENVMDFQFEKIVRT